MARAMNADNDRVFRAVIVVSWATGGTSTFTYGPYARKTDASRMVSREARSWKYSSGTAAGWVESSETNWKA